MASANPRTAVDLTADIITATDDLLRDEPEDVTKLFSGLHNDNIGPNGQFFSTGVMALCHSHMNSNLLWPNLEKWARDPDFPIHTLRDVLVNTATQFLHLQTFNGFFEIYKIGTAVIELACRSENRNEIADVISAFKEYDLVHYQWVKHAMFWHAGTGNSEFQHPRGEMTWDDPFRHIVVEGGYKIHFSVRKHPQAFGTGTAEFTVHAVLAVTLNNDLCQPWIDHLEHHGAVDVRLSCNLYDGNSSQGLCRILGKPQTDALGHPCTPTGHLKSLELTGDKLVCASDAPAGAVEGAVLGQVLPESVAAFEILRQLVKENTFARKEKKYQIWMTMQRG